ncbi:MAG TPA: hypothetical protein VJ853_04920 [Thermoanaerobaculia bacterium]|nr:hypothetical protein [Thermoanaerobaculia bacterium]
MKKILACVAVLLPAILFAAAGGAGAGHPIYVNGKLFSNAVDIKGTLAVPLEDLSKAVGANVSLEPAFQLQGRSLVARAGWDVKKNVKTAVKGDRPAVSDIHFTHTYDKASPVLFQINKQGAITNNVLTLNGKSYVPLADVVKAFGASWLLPANIAPGAAIQLNFTRNPNAILIGL